MTATKRLIELLDQDPKLAYVHHHTGVDLHATPIETLEFDAQVRVAQLMRKWTRLDQRARMRTEARLRQTVENVEKDASRTPHVGVLRRPGP